MRGTSSLNDKKNELENKLKEWELALSAGRNKYFLLNFYRSYQFNVLYKFFNEPSKVEYHNEALSLFKLIDPEIEIESVQNVASEMIFNWEILEAIISGIGIAMQTIFKNTDLSIRPLTHPSNSTPSSTENIVADGEIFIVKLEEDSPQTANIMLALFENTCKSFPLPHEILYCRTKTEWEEVNLLLNRCILAPERICPQQKSLHCIANVDLLQPEIRDQLEKRLKNQTKNDYERQGLKHRLALICRGKKCSNFFSEFGEDTHEINGMTDTDLSTCIEKHFPNVIIYTSVLPGLGKTERIKHDACEKGKNIITFAIYDSVDWSKLVGRLKCLSIKSYHCLHFDIGQVDDPALLDSFLFQLIIVGMVSSETQLFHLPTNHVYIEIANTFQNSLRNSLQICKYFKSVHLNSFKYDDMIVSEDVNSNVQIVCRYFDAYQSKCLDDKDICFRDDDWPKPWPLSPEKCRQLLSEYFYHNKELSFTILKTFLAFLADQLRKFSQSAYFKVESLQRMLGKTELGIRTTLFETLIDVSKEFSSRSIKTRSDQQNEAILSTNFTFTEVLVNRFHEMLRWEDSNHLILVFHGRDSQSTTAIYRDKDKVPNNVKQLLITQTIAYRDNTDIVDFNSMSSSQLRETLLKIASTESNKTSDADPNYAITADNIHKMSLIILRVRARIPVILMGETGCGKTSLVRYLATTCKIPFSVFPLHAGIQEQQIVQYIKQKESHVKKETWIFLDEINTTNHLGLISEIICHHTLYGRPLSKNLVFLAACNPYKLRSEKQMKTAGLQFMNNSKPDEYSRLVYRVHPLPEAMFDYVWDFGSLKESDEMSYIRRMVVGLDSKVDNDLLASLLAVSQKFVRNVDGNFSVSLRDVNRCINLIKWFNETLKIMQQHPIPNEKTTRDLAPAHAQSDACDPVIKSCVLGLAHCYLYRLSTEELREQYCKEMVQYLESYNFNIDTFTAVVRVMEGNFLNRMVLPRGTCKNNALRENVFVVLVSILNKIPVFLVGKPGCSKSLSMRLIKDNLRGRDSNICKMRQKHSTSCFVR